MGSKKLPPEPSKPSAKAAERLAVIVDAAERAALGVIDDAEKEAQRYLEEAKARADQIAAERLRETADELENGGISGPSLAQSVEAPAAAPEPEAEEAGRPVERLRVMPEPEQPPVPNEAAAKPSSAAARLLATQMAVSGASRQEIEMRLRNGFEIDDTGEILDAILGPEG